MVVLHNLVTRILSNRVQWCVKIKHVKNGECSNAMTHIWYTYTSNIRPFVDGNIKHKNDHIKYVEVQNISAASIANFKNAIGKSDLLSQLDLNHNADPNVNYNYFLPLWRMLKISTFLISCSVLTVVSIS